MTKSKTGPAKVPAKKIAPPMGTDFIALFNKVVGEFPITQAVEESKGFSDRLDWIIAKHMGDALEQIPTYFTRRVVDQAEWGMFRNIPDMCELFPGGPEGSDVEDDAFGHIGDMPRMPNNIPTRLGDPNKVFGHIAEMPRWAM
ncbi:MAG TPA: hypothetical protein VJH33_02245 [Candidatus Paceibacterota bacterium]